jgi:uncharacterized membrane protein YfcA
VTAALAIGVWAIVLAGFLVEGVIGFGSTVIVVSLGSQLLPVEQLLPAFVPLNVLLSTWLLLRGRALVAWGVLARELAAPVLLGLAAGMALASVAPTQLLRLVLAGGIVVLAAIELRRAVAAPSAEAARPLPRLVRLVVYGLGGVAHGLFAVGGPLITYALRRTLTDKGAFRATLAVLWLTLNSTLLVRWTWDGAFTRDGGVLTLVMATALIPGAWLGDRLHHRLPADKFARLVWTVLLAAGLALGVRTLVAM